MNNPRRRFLYGLIIACMVFAMSIIVIIMCIWDIYFSYNISQFSLFFFIFSFISLIFSSVFVMKCTEKLKFIIDYGDPILQASNVIKEMVRNANIYGVENLAHLVEKETKKQIDKVIKEKMKKGLE